MSQEYIEANLALFAKRRKMDIDISAALIPGKVLLVTTAEPEYMSLLV